MNVSIQMVPPAEMRYQTVGDWQVKDGTLVVTVAQSGDYRTDLLVGIHEVIEAVLYLDHGGSEAAVDDFDIGWDDSAAAEVYDEAGDDPRAPYHREHVTATIIERMLAHQLGMTWEEHNGNVEKADDAVAEARKGKR